MMRSVRNDPPKFGTTADEVRKFERVLEYIDGQILSGLLFEVGTWCLSDLHSIE